MRRAQGGKQPSAEGQQPVRAAPVRRRRGACEFRLPAGSHSLSAHGETRAKVDISDGDTKDVLIDLR